MALLNYAVTGGVLVVLHLVAIALYLDTRGKQRVLGAAVEALQRQTGVQAREMATLSRAIAAVAAGDPGNVKLTGAVPRPDDPARLDAQDTRDAINGLIGTVTHHGNELGALRRTVAATVRRLDALAPLSPPTAASAATWEATVPRDPQVDTDGDRGGINPGDAIPDDAPAPSKAEQIQRSLDALRAEYGDDVPPELLTRWRGLLRAKAEAEADARSQARPATTAKPDAPDDRDSETRVYDLSAARAAASRDREDVFIVAELDAADLARVDALAVQRGISREQMLALLAAVGSTANDAHRAPVPTPPPGVPANDRTTLTPTEPEGLDPRIAKRWAEKIEAARANGIDVSHCGRPSCKRQPRAAAECDCRCAPCARRANLLADAVREVLRGK